MEISIMNKFDAPWVRSGLLAVLRLVRLAAAEPVVRAPCWSPCSRHPETSGW
jgi:hypothetical protein